MIVSMGCCPCSSVERIPATSFGPIHTSRWGPLTSLYSRRSGDASGLPMICRDSVGRIYSKSSANAVRGLTSSCDLATTKATAYHAGLPLNYVEEGCRPRYLTVANGRASLSHEGTTTYPHRRARHRQEPPGTCSNFAPNPSVSRSFAYQKRSKSVPRGPGPR